MKKLCLHLANTLRLQSISDTLAAQLAKYPNLNELAQKAFIRYCRSVYKQKDKEVFDIFKLPLDEFALSLGLSVTPKIRFLAKKMKDQKVQEETHNLEECALRKEETLMKSNLRVVSKKNQNIGKLKESVESDVFLKGNATQVGEEASAVLPTRILKKKKLKINLDRPVGSRVIFDDEGNELPPLAALAANGIGDCGKEMHLSSKVEERYVKLREEMKRLDREDKLLQKKRLREGRTKEKMKVKRRREEQQAEEEDRQSGSDGETQNGSVKNSKVYFDSDNDSDGGERTGKRKLTVDAIADSISLAEQEALALKLMSSMHS